MSDEVIHHIRYICNTINQEDELNPMKRKNLSSIAGSLAAAGLILILAGCARPECDTIFQVCTIDALFSGVYDGQVPCRELLEKGNLGTGTYDRLDGELTILDGKLYQVKASGKVIQPDPSITTPYATVCRFEPDQEFPAVPGADLDSLKMQIDQKASNMNLFCAVKITGRFKSVLTRSVPCQEKPYPPLAVVTAHQPEFTRENVSGTIVGFRFPEYFKGINIPGYHLHFISADGTFGGHLLDFTVTEGNCAIDVIHRYELKLPENDAGFAGTDLSHDRSHEYEKVEGNRK